MHLQLLAMPAAGSEKATQNEPGARLHRLQRARDRSQRDQADLTIDTARATSLELLGLVSEHPLDNRYAGRREAQRLPFDKHAGQFDAVQQSPGDQAVGCAALSASEG